MFRGADRSLKNNSDEDAHQVAVASGHIDLANIIQGFRSEEVGGLCFSCSTEADSARKLDYFYLTSAKQL